MGAVLYVIGGINLPDAVLKKVYYQNALRIMPALGAAAMGFPK